MSVLLALAFVPAAPPRIVPPVRPVPVITVPPIIDQQPPAAELFGRAVKPVATQPLPRLFSANDYPSEALRLGQEGLTEVALTIGEDGRVKRCSLTKSSGSTALDVTTCRILQTRARFEPARDSSGRAVTSAETSRIRWALPPQRRVPFAPWQSEVTFSVGSDHQIRCTEQLTPPAPRFVNSCENRNIQNIARMLAWRERENAEEVTIRSYARMVPGSPPANRSIIGEKLGHLSAELQVGADGSLTGCTMRDSLQPGPAVTPPDCKRLFPGPYSVAAADVSGAAGPRTAFIELILTRVTR